MIFQAHGSNPAYVYLSDSPVLQAWYDRVMPYAFAWLPNETKGGRVLLERSFPTTEQARDALLDTVTAVLRAEPEAF